MRSVRQRVRARAAAAAAGNRPNLSTAATPAEVPPTDHDAGLRDWPAIARRHPTWWQVHRVELVDEGRAFVLIAECRTEREAFLVAARQASQIRITRWGSRDRPYFSLRDPRDTRTRTPA